MLKIFLTFTAREYYLQQRNQYERQECTRIHASSTQTCCAPGIRALYGTIYFAK